VEMNRPNWLLKPIEEYDELPLDRIALQLSRLNRYAVAVEWSVLQHSLLVWDLVKTESATCQAWALLHDAAECWIGDALLPAKQVAGLAWSNLEETYDGHIQRLAGLNVDQSEWQMVRDADKEACRIEMSTSLFPDDLRPIGFDEVPHADAIVRQFAFSRCAISARWLNLLLSSREVQA
jgi:5'-deoxynucleotidase YfbR-like HD superfamily hydrolase